MLREKSEKTRYKRWNEREKIKEKIKGKADISSVQRKERWK